MHRVFLEESWDPGKSACQRGYRPQPRPGISGSLRVLGRRGHYCDSRNPRKQQGQCEAIEKNLLKRCPREHLSWSLSSWQSSFGPRSALGEGGWFNPVLGGHQLSSHTDGLNQSPHEIIGFWPITWSLALETSSLCSLCSSHYLPLAALAQRSHAVQAWDSKESWTS